MRILLLLPFLIFSQEKDALREEALENFEVLPKSMINAVRQSKRIALGKKLYFEKRLSINNTISCNSCHDLKNFGVDNQATSPGHDGTRGGRNSPTVYNAALHFSQFWDGRAKDVEEQALGPLLNPIEHGLKTKADAMKKIDTPEYRKMFKAAFKKEKNPFKFKNIGRAIGAFERTLLTRSRFDDFLEGKGKLYQKEREGLKAFIEIGCTTCHNGPAIGGTHFQKLGLEKPFDTKDLGRFDVTKDEDDKFVFKVPSLRNIHETGPYFHDGHLKRLETVIEKMAWHQLGVKISKEDRDAIKIFLKTLTAKELPKF